MRTRSAVVALGALVVAAALVSVGRWEARRAGDHEVKEMTTVLRAVGNVYRRRPTGYRIGPPECLTYATPQNLYGLQLCFDESGRLIETVDRRSVQPRYASVAYDPSLSNVHLPVRLLKALFSLRRVPG